MVNQLFTLPNTIQRLRQGPLNEHLDSYANLVAHQGYALNSIRSQIVVIADLSRWLQLKNIAAVNLDGKVVARFLKVHGRQDGIRRGDLRYFAEKARFSSRTSTRRSHGVAAGRWIAR